jgi:hypothetical protein
MSSTNPFFVSVQTPVAPVHPPVVYKGMFTEVCMYTMEVQSIFKTHTMHFLSGDDDDDGDDAMGGMGTKSKSSKGMGMVMGKRVLRGNKR